MRHPRVALSLTAINAGTGSDVDKRAQFERDIETLNFLTLVESGRWRPRDSRSMGLSVLSNKG
jgi:hypothetical protein